jgi:hypothetical protein
MWWVGAVFNLYGEGGMWLSLLASSYNGVLFAKGVDR